MRRLPPLRLAIIPIGAIIGILLLVLLLRSVNIDQLGSTLASADWFYLGLSLIPFLANWLLKVPRWAILFGSDAPGWDTLFGAMNVGYAVNTLLPARLGELVRAYWVRDRAGVGIVRTLSTILLERLSDGLTLIIFLLIAAPTVAFPGTLRGPALTIGAVFVALLLALVAAAYGASEDNSWVSRLLSVLEQGRARPLAGAARQIIGALQVLRNRRALLLNAFYSLLLWGCNALFVWLLLRALHISVPFSAGILLVAVLNLGMAVPSSPGYVGVFEYLMVLTLALFGVARTPALAAAFALHFLAFVPVTVVGLIYIARALGSTLQMLRVSFSRVEETT